MTWISPNQVSWPLLNTTRMGGNRTMTMVQIVLYGGNRVVTRVTDRDYYIPLDSANEFTKN